MTIYLDVVFVENICMNSIILFATGLITKTKCKIIRNLVSSMIRSTICYWSLYNKKWIIFKFNN